MVTTSRHAARIGFDCEAADLQAHDERSDDFDGERPEGKAGAEQGRAGVHVMTERSAKSGSEQD
ncbi:MAG: hypothetical protein BGN87_03350 [Rhizobiales bacterium 65-79]|nr:MAG: hypothetical protein BGN87_03350 [Rhizobiales bacterium 65-79]